MKRSTLRILGAAFAATLLSTASSLAAQCPAGFPSKSVTMVVGFGAGGGTDTIARALVGAIGTDAIAINPTISDVGYTWDDFDYLGSGMQTWLGLAALADAPFDDLPGLVQLARDKGRATVSVAGVNQEILIKQIADEFGVELVAIPGSGAAEALTSALGGHVDATTQGTLHVEQIEAGKMKLIASIIDRRVPHAQNVGTLEEQGSKTQPLISHTIFMTAR